jgi:hypothetical protein
MDIASSGNARVDAALQKTQRPHILYLLADLDAAPAGDTFARIQRDRMGRFIQR